MRIRNLTLVFIAICIFIVTGCSNILGNENKESKCKNVLVMINMKILR